MTPAADDVADVKKLDRQWAEYATKGDTAALSRLLADDVRYVHSSGAIDTKQTLVSTIASGALVYHAIDSEDVQVRIIGSAAILTSTTRLRVNSHGQEHDFQARFLRVYVRTDSAWRLAFHQGSKIT
jgi:ketosteroid isomerase-like protein